MPWARKSRVVSVFGVGLFACIASILHLVYSSELTRVPPKDPTYQLDIDRIGLWAYTKHSPINVFIILTTAQFRRDSNLHHSRLPTSPTQVL